jgi:uncharacterized RDD family membrane protein YckC
VIKTCEHCGAVNGAPAETCFFCDASLARSGPESAPRRVSAPATEGNLALNPDWRREVSTKLHTYRQRRNGGAVAEQQSALPFEPPAISSFEYPGTAETPELPKRFDLTIGSPKQRAERYEISIPAHESSTTVARMDRPVHCGSGVDSAGAPLFPVAPLSDRRKAAALDTALLLFSYGGMLALFTVLGGHIGPNKFDALVTAATLVVFYAQYFALFTIFGGSSPGMMVRGLRVVSFDGNTPTSQQMAWRSFGYLISAGTCFLGFLWALWDEDHLTWQDRISQTYITPVEEFADESAPGELPEHQETYR